MKTIIALLSLAIFAGCSTAPVRVSSLEPVAETLMSVDLPDMSETTRFLHPRPFPFCQSEAGDPNTTYGGMDYVATTGGIAGAMQIWWNVEFLEISTSVGATVRMPDDIGLNPPFETIAGSIIAMDSDSPVTPIPAAEPMARVCFAPPSKSEYATVLYTAINTGISPEFLVRFIVAYVDSEWRLYYSFKFMSLTDEVVIINAGNDFDLTGWTMIDSGDVNIFGYDMPWQAWRGPSSSETSASITASDGFFTYPAP